MYGNAFEARLHRENDSCMVYAVSLVLLIVRAFGQERFDELLTELSAVRAVAR